LKGPLGHQILGCGLAAIEEDTVTAKLRRSLFGFSPQRVHELLADRDYGLARALERTDSLERELSQARERLEAAERTATEAGEHATATEERIQGLEAELSAARAELARVSQELAAKPADPILDLLVQGLAPILETAKQSAAAMMEEAAAMSQQRIGEAEQAMLVLQDRGRSMAAWWEGVQGLIQPMMSTLEQVRARIAEVPGRVEEALAPLAETVGAVREQLGTLASASEPPAFPPRPDQDATVVDLTRRESGASEEGDPEGDQASAPAAMGFKRGPNSWWPEVSPSASSFGL
jgi:septal ring factor EnvC (AmiA/AmiB activator)